MAATKLNPYLSFRDQARQAMEFYKTVLGGELTLNTFEESHASDDPSEGQKIMHAQLESNGMTLMASDTPNAMEHKSGSSISVSLSGDNLEELTGYYNKLAEGGTKTLPFEKAPWGDTFGIVVDKFGVQWMVNAAGEKA